MKKTLVKTTSLLLVLAMLLSVFAVFGVATRAKAEPERKIRIGELVDHIIVKTKENLGDAAGQLNAFLSWGTHKAQEDLAAAKDTIVGAAALPSIDVDADLAALKAIAFTYTQPFTGEKFTLSEESKTIILPIYVFNEETGKYEILKDREVQRGSHKEWVPTGEVKEKYGEHYFKAKKINVNDYVTKKGTYVEINYNILNMMFGITPVLAQAQLVLPKLAKQAVDGYGIATYQAQVQGYKDQLTKLVALRDNKMNLLLDVQVAEDKVVGSIKNAVAGFVGIVRTPQLVVSAVGSASEMFKHIAGLAKAGLGDKTQLVTNLAGLTWDVYQTATNIEGAVINVKAVVNSVKNFGTTVGAIPANIGKFGESVGALFSYVFKLA